jgi:1-acyl-sn-glycerol-3-phosphate acyltransferase
MYPIISQCSSVGLEFHNGSYKTGPRRIFPLWKALPTLGFYRSIFSIILRAGARAKWGTYDTTAWCESSLEVLRALERIGTRVEITGIDHFRDVKGPCVFLSNHMSTLETFVLPVIIAPIKPVTFVVKESLVQTPVFKYVMRSRDPITVGRTNPREDLKAVLEGGTERLKSGISIIIFPQTTRFLDFDPNTFNTIGIKLARKAGVPAVPVALKTDAWGNGKYLKDFGRMDPSLPVHFAFGKPQWIKDRGTEEHSHVIEFIGSRLKEWRREDTVPAP